MSLFEDILESEKIQTLINNNSVFKKTYDIIQNRKEIQFNNLSDEEKEDENYRFSRIVKNESK